jgi:hypothetical protein
MFGVDPSWRAPQGRGHPAAPPSGWPLLNSRGRLRLLAMTGKGARSRSQDGIDDISRRCGRTHEGHAARSTQAWMQARLPWIIRSRKHRSLWIWRRNADPQIRIRISPLQMKRNLTSGFAGSEDDRWRSIQYCQKLDSFIVNHDTCFALSGSLPRGGARRDDRCVPWLIAPPGDGRIRC